MPPEQRIDFKLLGMDKLRERLEIGDAAIRGMRKAGAFMEGKVKELTPVNKDRTPGATRGRLAAAWTTRTTVVPGNITTLVGNNVFYGCVIGSRQKVYNPQLRVAVNIGNYPYQTVLSKDGLPHRIAARMEYHPDEIDGVSIQTRRGRKPLIVTSNHLVLIWRDGKVLWEAASSLRETDMLFGKRAHNAVTDHSNERAYLCFCGTIFYVQQSALRARDPKYCSSACRHRYGPHDQNTGMRWELSEDKKRYGPSNPQWRDGSSRKPYDYRFNGRLKHRVKERDGFMCQSCETPFDLVVHHVDWNKMNSDIDNLITLCRSCHGRLNARGAELPEVDVSLFVPRPIMAIEQFKCQRNGRGRIPFLYDFTINGENSYMVSGMLIHNSFVEHGTNGPYEIRPTKAKALRFLIGGRVVFARRVTHPGIRGQHFAKRAFEANQGAAREIVLREIDSHLGGSR